MSADTSATKDESSEHRARPLTRLDRADRRCKGVLVPAALTLIGGALAVSATSRWSVTFDEVFHIVSGYSYWQTGDFRLLPDHPPLPGLLSALPLLPLDLASPFAGEQWETGNYWRLGQTFLAPPNDADRIALLARLPIVLLWLAGGWIVWAWSQTLFGRAGALVSACLYVFYPDLMAHGSLATTDAAATVFFVAALFAWSRLIQRATWQRWLLAAAAIAALLLSKYSGLLLVPVIVVVAAAVCLRRRPWAVSFGRRTFLLAGWRRAAAMGGACLLCAAFVFVAIWACFGFRYRAALDPPGSSYSHMLLKEDVRDPRTELNAEDRRFLIETYGRDDLSVLDQLLHKHPIMRVLVRWTDDHRLLPEAYLYCLAGTTARADVRMGYLMGQVSPTGWWYYFPVAFLLKMPAATIAVMVLAAAAAVHFRRYGDTGLSLPAASNDASFRRDSVLVMVVFECVYWLASINTHLNIGHRHLLPVYPPLFVLAGAAGWWLSSTRRAAGVFCGLLVAGTAVTNLLTWPHYIAYFTELIGGPAQGPKYLSDSNVDWGQDLKFLARYLRGHPRDDVKLSYFGTADPGWYGLDVSYFEYTTNIPLWQDLPGTRRLAEFTPGTYVFSVTNLHGVYMQADLREWNDRLQQTLEDHEGALRDHHLHGKPLPDDLDLGEMHASLARLYYAKLTSRLRHRKPDAVAGRSLFIFDLDEKKLLDLMTQ